MRWTAFLTGTRLLAKKLPARTEWYDRDPHRLSRQCHANLSVSCLRGTNFMFRKHAGHTLFRASSLWAKHKSNIGLGLSLKIAGARTSRKRCIVAGWLRLRVASIYIAGWWWCTGDHLSLHGLQPIKHRPTDSDSCSYCLCVSHCIGLVVEGVANVFPMA